MATVSCPYCGFNTEFEQDHKPEIGSRLTCEKCQHDFPVRRIDETSGKETNDGKPQGQEPPDKAGKPRSADSIKTGPVAGTVTITCPECGFSSPVPRAKIPPRPINLNCRKCQHHFTFNLAETDSAVKAEELHPVFSSKLAEEPEPEQERAYRMSPLGELFGRTFRMFKKRLLILVGINLLGALLVAAASFVFQSGIGMLQSLLGENLVTIVLTGLLALFFSLLAISWIAGATICAIVEEDSGVREALNSGFQKTLPFLWVFSLLGFIIGGGSMAFLLPGILFTVWFIFAQYIVATEGTRGMVALLKSREYVRGYGWEVCGRIVLLGVLTTIIMFPLSLIPIVGPLVGLLIGPFTLIFYNEIYRDLKAIKGDIVVSCTTGDKAKWLVAGAAGFLLVPMLAFLLMGPAFQQGVMMALQGAGGNTMQQTYEPSYNSSSQLQVAEEPVARTETMVYIFAYNYRGRIKLNGAELYIIEGEENMSYNHTTDVSLTEGLNQFDVEYHTRFKSGNPEIRIKVYQFDWASGEETTLAEWTIDDERGKKSFELNVAKESPSTRHTN